MSSDTCVVCGKEAPNRCARCLSTAYCGKEHQTQDWPNHKKTACWPVKIRTYELGNCVIATRPIKRGEIIALEEPLVLGPDFQVFMTPCLGCLNPLPMAETCPKCHWPVCSKQCPGLKDPLFHGAECEFLAAARTFLLSPEVVLPLRILLLQNNNPKKWNLIKEMSVKAMPRIHTSKCDKSKSVFLETLPEPLSRYSPKIPLDYSADAVKVIYAFLDAYGLELKLLHTSELVGAGEIASTMEHSCLPNTKRIFDFPSPHEEGVLFKSRFIIKAARDIEQGEHLTASFARNLMSTYTRQQFLMTSRGLFCYCARCLDPREFGTNFNTLKCVNVRCFGDLLPVNYINMLESEWRCYGKCGRVYPASYVKNLLSRTVSVIAAHQEEKFSLRKLEELLKQLQKSFHTNHYFCVKLKTRLFTAYGAMNNDEDIMNTRMAELGLSGLPGAGNRLLIRMSDEELQRKAELCEEVLGVLGNPFFESTDGALDACLTQLSFTTAEIARRKKESGEWSAERVEKALAESRALFERAIVVRYQFEDTMEVDPRSLLGGISKEVLPKKKDT